MSYTLTNVKADLTSLLHGTSIDNLQGVSDYALFRRAFRDMRNRVHVAGSRRISLLTDAVHGGIYNYTAPADFDDSGIIDLRPQVNVGLNDNTLYASSQDFSLRKDIEIGKLHFSVRNDDGSTILNIDRDSKTNAVTLEDVGDTTGWTASNDATNLTEDTTNYVYGNSSLNYDVSGAGSTATLAKTITSQDLTSHDEQSTLFVRHFFPNGSAITNVELRWGNSASVYWSRTITSPFDQSSFHNGWNILNFDWNGATETGTVDPAAIDYVEITVTYDGTADTDLRLDLITSSLGEILETEYYSTYGFRNTSGTFLEVPTADTDIINVDPDAEPLFLYECVKQATRQTQGQDSGRDLQEIRADLFGDGTTDSGIYRHYRANHPSQAIKIQKRYYRV